MFCKAAANAGVEVALQTRTKKLHWDAHSERWQIACTNNETSWQTQACFLVDATGRHSRLRHLLGCRQTATDSLVGAGMLFNLENRECGQFTLIEAAPNGWWYSAPLPNNKLIALYMTELELYRRDIRGNLARYQRLLELTELTRERLQSAEPIGKITLSPAGSHCVTATSEASWLPIGDSLMAWDPLSGHGIVNALSKTQDKAHIIADWFRGKDHRANYLEATAREYSDYCQTRQRYYAEVGRWQAHRFWMEKGTR